MRYIWRCLAVLTALALLPATAAAQEDDYELELPQESTYIDLGEGWKERRFRVGGFSGQMTGGTPLGSIENVFFRSSYDMDTDSMWGLRVRVRTPVRGRDRVRKVIAGSERHPHRSRRPGQD